MIDECLHWRGSPLVHVAAILEAAGQVVTRVDSEARAAEAERAAS
jgi:hypothetical protein